jgi:hypothetical protein
MGQGRRHGRNARGSGSDWFVGKGHDTSGGGLPAGSYLPPVKSYRTGSSNQRR